ncbi:hypothetical protein [Neisseria chenwenguii]|nr:hypothetical protein [Neisseria chenwenguii]
MAKAEAIKAEVAALSSEISKTDAAKVTAAHSNFDALTDLQETWVESESVKALTGAENTIKTNQEKADEAAREI